LENKVRQFHKEKADLEDAIDILKKAAAFFAQHQKSIP
jgi:exonuclease VII small subunit